jgi:hypothetical protein
MGQGRAKLLGYLATRDGSWTVYWTHTASVVHHHQTSIHAFTPRYFWPRPCFLLLCGRRVLTSIECSCSELCEALSSIKTLFDSLDQVGELIRLPLRKLGILVKRQSCTSVMIQLGKYIAAHPQSTQGTAR